MGVGSAYVLPIEIVFFFWPHTNLPARKARFVPLSAPWITDPEICGTRKPTWKQYGLGVGSDYVLLIEIKKTLN